MNKRDFLKANPPNYSPAGYLLQMLDMYKRLIKRGMESVDTGKIPYNHCLYLSNFIETKTIPLLEEIVQGLRDKAKE